MNDQLPFPPLPEPLSELMRRYEVRDYVIDERVWRVVDTASTAGTDLCPLVMLPGALGSHLVFYRQWKHLDLYQPARRVILVDYPGSSDLTRMAAAFEELMRLLKVERAIFAGSSLGACWLQVFTSSIAPSMVQRTEHLLIGNAFVDAEPLQLNPLFVRSLVNDKPADELKKKFSGFIEAMPDGELRSAQICFARVQTAEQLSGRLRMVANVGAIPLSKVAQERMTVLTCDDDGVTTKDIGNLVCAAYPKARHVSFESGGHYPHVNQAARYNELLGEILALPI